MKRYITAIFLSVLAAAFTGCTDLSEELPASNLTVSSKSLWFDAGGGRQMLEIRTYAGSWSISQDTGSMEWCTLDKTSGSTSSSFYVETDANPDQERTGELVISAPGCDPVTITLTQNGAADEQMTITPENPDADQPMTILYKPEESSPLYDYSGDVYVHIGIVEGDYWKFTPATTETNAEKCRMTAVGDNTWTLELTPTIREWFGSGEAEVSKLGLLIRSEDHSLSAFRKDYYISVTDSKCALVHGEPVEEAVPDGCDYGINYNEDGSVTFVFAAYNRAWWNEAPGAKTIRCFDWCYLIGDFNDWLPSSEYAMKWDKERGAWWYTLTGIDPTREYMFQYYIGKDGGDSGEDIQMRLSDPFTKIVYTQDDQYISSSTYPGLPEYPSLTTGIVSAFRVQQDEYDWQNDGFTIRDENDMLIYELLLRDFSESGDLEGAMEHLEYLKTLGVDAIELMPVQEFDGNDSWGYNPYSHFALDKSYGTLQQYKEFVDRAHGLGMGVIVDVVYNHMTGNSTLAKMFWSTETNNVTAENPWFNEHAPSGYSVFHDLNHENEFVRQYVEKSLMYLVTEYHVDGFRFDVSGSFNWSDADPVGQRIEIFTRYYNTLCRESEAAGRPKPVVILEHWQGEDEEKQLANLGMHCWRNTNAAYCQAAMGYVDGSELWNVWSGNNWMRHGGYVSYAESHDEERMQAKIKDYSVSLLKDNLAERMKRSSLAGAFLLTVPGPKMLWQFQELGYDYSIDYGGRTSKKPLHWDYLEIPERKAVYDNYASLMKFRHDNPDLFTGDASFSWQVGYDNWTTGRFITCTNGSKTFIVAGNFDTQARRLYVEAPSAGTWTNYLDPSDSYTATTAGERMEISLGQGEYKLLVNFDYSADN